MIQRSTLARVRRHLIAMTLPLMLGGNAAALETWEVYTDPSTLYAISVDDAAVWAAGRGGLVRQDRATGEIDYITPAQGLPGIDLTDVLSLDGKVWIATAEEGLARYTPGAADPWFRYQTLPQGLAHDNMLCLSAGPDGALWYGTEAGCGRITGSSHDIWTTLQGLDNDQVHALAFRADTLLIGTGAGLYRMAPGENPVQVDDAPGGGIRSVAVAADSVWVLTDEGELRRDRLDGDAWPTLALPAAASGLEVKAVAAEGGRLALSLGEEGTDGRADAVFLYDTATGWIDRSAGLPNDYHLPGYGYLAYGAIAMEGDELWLGGTVYGGIGPGLLHFDGAAWEQEPMADRTLGTESLAMRVTADDAVWWLSTVGGARHAAGEWERYPTKPSFASLPRFCLDMLEDTEGWVWFNNFTGAFGRFHLDTGEEEIIAGSGWWIIRMLEDELGNRWFCQNGEASDRTLSVFDASGVWHHYLQSDSPLPGGIVDRFVMLTPTRIACLVGGVGLWIWETAGTLDEYGDDDFWSAGDGIHDDDGLIDTDTQSSSIDVDAAGHLWIGQSSGLVRVLAEGGSYRAKASIGAKSLFEDGMIVAQVLDVACSADGSVWAGTAGGLSQVRLDIENDGGQELLRWTVRNWTNEAGREQAGTDLHGSEVLAPLPHPRVNQVEVESGGDVVWFGTNIGPVRLELSDDPPGNPEEIAGAWVYPNPVRAALGHDELRLGGIDQSARITVYNLEGQLVREMGQVAPGDVAWDLQTRFGNRAVSGIYLLKLEIEGEYAFRRVALVR